ncbi:MAG: dTDP-4-dehydrorhamnose reductase [Planctomycetes bacterium]|nr:dTDP-4-dehydrorhamnose reductase [Planctomycetota bacterium]
MACILLTGARGMLGRRLHEGFVDTGHRVTATELVDVDGLSGLDIVDRDAVLTAVRATRPDWIVNAAAYTAVDRAESEPTAAYAANAEGPTNLALAAAETGARLLHVSTDFVFSGESDGFYVEDDPTGAAGIYARSKEEGERRVRDALPDAHVILRVAWLFGPDGGNFVATMLRLGAERERLGVVDDQTGTPTFTRDAATVATRVVEADLRGTIHSANQGKTSWCGLARAALQFAGISTPVDAIGTSDYPTAAPRPKNSALRNQVLEGSIGNTMRPWREALDAYVAEL